MKRIFLFIACMVMLIGANAQSTSVERDYTYGFWSNWSIGASVDYDKYVGNSNFYI